MKFFPILNSIEDTLCIHHYCYSNLKLFKYIIKNFKSVNEVIENKYKIFQHFNLKKPDDFIYKLSTFNPHPSLKVLQRQKIKIVTINNVEYPQLLYEISDAPPILFYKGNIKCLKDECLAVVGPRKSTHYGNQAAEYFTKACSDYFTIVSGFAKGIDLIAHQTCVKENKKTIAVMGVGLDQCYPADQKHLFDKIIQSNGLLISEFPFFIRPFPFHFPQRNRIISGLSKGIIVCEAKQKSGSLITASHAIDQNREVFAVPGPIFNKSSIGCFKLIQDGAKCTFSASDILEEMNIKNNKKNTIPSIAKQNSLNDNEKNILNILTEPKHIDLIIESSNLTINQVLHILTTLELKELIIKKEGNIFEQKNNIL